MSPELSIVMPVYNEANVIEDVVGELTRDVCDKLSSSEIVMVDDASTDETPAILDRLAREDRRVRVHHAEQNGGHGRALRRALDEAEGDWIFQIDSDGQQVAAEFWELWRRRESADLVVGIRAIRRNGWHRVVVSIFARWLNRAIGGGNIRDVNVPFKLIHRPVWEDLRGAIPARPVAPSMLIAVGAATRGWRVAQVSITHLPRRHGPSSVDLKALFRLSWGAFSEMMRFRARLSRHPRAEPARSEDSVGAPS